MGKPEFKPAPNFVSLKSFAETAAPTSENGPEAQLFSLKTPLLEQGRLTNHVAKTALMKVSVKVYASGGENAMHMHPFEDHAFVVLEGQATFRIGAEENIKVLNKHDGVMLPRGTLYCFLSSAEENLVMLRMGAAEKWPENWRTTPDGRPSEGNSLENKDVEQVILPGQFFGG